MNLFGFFRHRGTAPVARERLQILLAHERTVASESDLVVVLREEILAVIANHLEVEPENVHVSMQCDDAISTLTVDVEMASQADMLLAANG
ncbi:MAG: cell division topological specificity factor MinE [Hyphomicrobiales bacterium]|nr:cell division topological specificity factor MinE [Hyphomicrobiales bacterium]